MDEIGYWDVDTVEIPQQAVDQVRRAVNQHEICLPPTPRPPPPQAPSITLPPSASRPDFAWLAAQLDSEIEKSWQDDAWPDRDACNPWEETIPPDPEPTVDTSIGPCFLPLTDWIPRYEPKVTSRRDTSEDLLVSLREPRTVEERPGDPADARQIRMQQMLGQDEGYQSIPNGDLLILTRAERQELGLIQAGGRTWVPKARYAEFSRLIGSRW